VIVIAAALVALLVFSARICGGRFAATPGAVVVARCARVTEWSCPRAMGPAPPAMEVVVKKVLGYERDEQGGGAVLLEVEIGGTVQELCRLVFPTEAGIAALRKFIADVSTTPSRDAG